MLNQLRLSILLALLVLIGSGRPAFAAEPQVLEADVCVYGGTAAGVIAAVTVAKEGKSVVLVEPGRHLGGMTSGGLGWTDFGNKAAIGGLSLDFYKRVGKEYGRDEPVWTFEPSVAEKVLKDLVEENALRVLFEHRVVACSEVQGPVVKGIVLEHAPPLASGAPSPTLRPGSPEMEVRADVFIDCTYEGDLMAVAGVSFHIGRESTEQYGESLNGIRATTPQHQFKGKVDPYIKPGNPVSGLLPLIQPGDGGKPGEGDHRVQAYNFRLCLTRELGNRIDIGPPRNYDPARYELLARHVESLAQSGQPVRLGQLLKIDMVTPAKTDINNNGAVSTDFIGQNWDYPEADYATRSRIWEAHLNYIQGLLYFLKSSDRLPRGLRDEMKAWGLCKDEFTDTGGWPHQMYVREARRMVGRYVITQADCEHRTTIDDAIGLGAYNMDSHNVQRIVKRDPGGDYVLNEGDVQVAPAGPYRISYRSITPKAKECENLLVPVCISASHIAYGSARMEPVFMVLGQSAGVAAVMVIDAEKSVQEIDVDKLRERLLAAGQVLDPPAVGAKGVDPKSLGGLVLDDRDDKSVELKGPWQQSTGRLAGHIGAGYLHDADQAKRQCTARFSFTSPTPGAYDLRIAYTAHPNRATNVPVTVMIEGGKAQLHHLNQREAPAIAPGMTKVGTVDLKAGQVLSVTISNEGTDGHVIVDAVQMIEAQPQRR